MLISIVTSRNLLFILHFSLTIKYIITSHEPIDPNGYLVYCPCMGRFGNQAEQFLGTLQFAKSINRTLILPPFIEYIDYKVNFIPFEDIFEIDPIREYHRVLTMSTFMTDLSPIVWPKANRSIACYFIRNFHNNKIKEGCNPFEGSPFKEFWYHIGVKEFPAGSLYYKPLHTDYNYAEEWKEKFQNIQVLALVGAPSSFPTNSKAIKLSKHIYFNKNIMEKANRYREERNFARKPYLAIHLRHGPDWIRACELIHSNTDLKQLFSSAQCMGERDKLIKTITFDLCLPSDDQIIDAIKLSLKTYNEEHKEPIKHIYIATDFDNRTLWLMLNETLAPLTLITPSLTLNPETSINGQADIKTAPHFLVDLYLLSHGNAFIGNCISSFSAFVSRFRLHRLHFFSTTHFFAFHRPNSIHLRDEL